METSMAKHGANQVSPIITGSMNHENLIVLNIYRGNNRASNYMKQKKLELKEEMEKLFIVVGYFHILLLMINRTCRQKNERHRCEHCKPT